MHEGHRQRMLERLSRSDDFCEHELLEMLLYNAVPRKNTNELAHDLLTAFGTVEGVLSAPMKELTEVKGVGEGVAAYLHILGLFFVKLPKTEVPAEVLAYNVHEFSAYLKERMEGYSDEVVEIFCVDAHSRIRYCRQYSSSKNNAASVPPEQISALFVEHRPAGIVLAHNHPIGKSAPSVADDEFTARVQLMCSVNNIRLCDHLVVGEDGVYSYFTSGRLDVIRDRFSYTAIARREGLV